jgi:DNA replication licensing factor MCM3
MLCSEIELTGEAMEVIGDYYATLRSRADDSALPITVRTLETVIRLSTAAAKARLAKGVCLHALSSRRRLICLSAVLLKGL